ncbi:MAG: DNA-directed RNA polymerase subunit A' [Candidatus Aenigmarchaeota archaeon]|nr:DNA-directed RNA polymerase subunit A' [Candidatus Aenigmarchaeota archaeon]
MLNRGVMMSKVSSIDFGVLSPQMIKKMATVKIDKAELYDPDGYPINGGLCDLRLGVVDPGLRCRVCGATAGNCLGHFGYLELTKPVIHPIFGKHIYHLLKITCRKCGRLLATDEEIKGMKNPWKEIYKNPRKKCPHCDAEQKRITFQKPTTYREDKQELTAEEVRERLERISNEDLKLLGINGGRPEWLVLTLLPIPPVTVRPSITLETGERSEDDLTHKLVDIIRINERLKKNIELGAPDFIIKDIWELLQYHVSTLMNNEISTIPPARHRSGRSLKTLAQRLTKKEGRFRGNLSGKRVNFSARTVISPDPCISIDEVGVPLVIAKNLTVPVRVNKNNIKELRQYILNGSDIYPGANYIIRPDGVKKKITEENKQQITEEIDIGYIVERHLKDGDIVIFNRQPSLHRMSMMAHRVRVMNYKTFRLNLCSTIPYNADFDGDEMNLHVPQTEEAQIEARMLMAVQDHIRSPRYGLPIISCKHDHITGCYLLTKKGTKVPKKKAARLLMRIDMEDKATKDYDGKELFSLLIPKGLNIEFRAASCVGCKKCLKENCPYDAYVVIKKGILKSGVIDENALGEKKGKLLNRIERQFGPEVAKEFLNKVSVVALEFITHHGFTVSVTDSKLDPKTEKKIEKLLEETNKEVEELVRDYKRGKLKELPGMGKEETLETLIQKKAGDVTDKIGKIVKDSLGETNAVIMAKTGARGSFVNLTQTCASVGQEFVGGKRISRGFTGRTLSHFKREDMGLKSRGFVFHGYKRGLDPFEFFFDAMNSRENLMDKSLQTRHSGYMERRLVNALQDLIVEEDLTVRDSYGTIIQFVAGEDGIDPAKSDGGKVNFDLLEK